MKLEREAIIRLNLWKQGLYHMPTANTKDEAMAILRRLGLVQLDTMSVVTRSQHLVFWSRMQEFREEWLLEWYEQGEIFELYLHALSILPEEERTYFQSWMDASRGKLDMTELHHVLLQTLQERGTVHGKHVNDLVGGTTAKLATWEMSPVRRAFDQLWRAGHVAITRNEKFQKVYQLQHPVKSVSADETHIRYTRLALQAMGAATLKDIADYFRFKPNVVQKALQHLPDVRELDDGTYILEEDLELLHSQALTEEPPTHATLLSPFDNLIWYRPRVKALFDLDFRLESYFPEDKRQFGYFALPILMQGRIVGTIDLKAERKSKTLQIQRLIWREDPRQSELDELLDRLHKYLFLDAKIRT
ncbi:YcaQ family DNA glycosylase [Tumebacillus sp. ITR2]|uniref:YcaQ family DNA glycosylase n=1 Tax=Tumebacillus amylolyticus TaxID=2801339 RepID=A0ABS1JDF7_9BACL|nr:crosslink repair DNA glycosylase YcaQ family protein [Tumebacillus amylolyticus]MBL0388328.1 YcaQ family DNA glycosylase [Tumebacillus amylolyticus]